MPSCHCTPRGWIHAFEIVCFYSCCCLLLPLCRCVAVPLAGVAVLLLLSVFLLFHSTPPFPPFEKLRNKTRGGWLSAYCCCCCCCCCYRYTLTNKIINHTHLQSKEETIPYLPFHSGTDRGECTNVFWFYLQMTLPCKRTTKLRNFEMSINLQNSYKRRQYLKNLHTTQVIVKSKNRVAIINEERPLSPLGKDRESSVSAPSLLPSLPPSLTATYRRPCPSTPVAAKT